MRLRLRLPGVLRRSNQLIRLANSFSKASVSLISTYSTLTKSVASPFPWYFFNIEKALSCWSFAMRNLGDCWLLARLPHAFKLHIITSGTNQMNIIWISAGKAWIIEGILQAKLLPMFIVLPNQLDCNSYRSDSLSLPECYPRGNNRTKVPRGIVNGRHTSAMLSVCQLSD